MRRLISSLAACLFTVSAQAAVTLQVNVNNSSGSPVAGAMVYAIVFTTSGPNGAASRIGVTSSTGVVVFSDLVNNTDYEIFVSSNGFSPTLREQFSSPDPALHKHVIGADTTATPLTYTLTPKSGMGMVVANVSNATASQMLFGHLSKASNHDEVAFGACLTNGSGDGTLIIPNVPAAAANTYKVGIHDQSANKGTEAKVTHVLAAGSFVGPYALDLDDGLPPQSVDQNDGPRNTGDASVEGVVMSTNNAPIPWIGISYERPTGGSVWTNSDQNGRFTLFGLENGATYYARIMAGCNQQGCFDGHNSTAASSQGAMLGVYDILFSSAQAPMKRQIQLSRLQGGTGEIPIYVQTPAGVPIPRAGVNVWPDWKQWDVNPNAGCDSGMNDLRQNPGLSNANVQATTGYALITGLPAGNYSINVWTPFSQQGTQYNGGVDNQFGWEWNQNCSGGVHVDDLRVTVTTSPAGVKVYSATGVDLNISSVVVTVNPNSAGANATVQGTMTFPEVADLRSDPISINLQACGEGGCSGGFALVNSSGASSYNYSMVVSTGKDYWVNVESAYWGMVRAGGDRGNLTVPAGAPSGPITMNFKFARAGRLTGKLYKPDGAIFQPSTQGGEFSNANINARGMSVQGWGNTQVNQDGTFSIGGLLPGIYELQVQGQGDFDYSTPLERTRVTITAGQDSYADINLVDGAWMRPFISTTVWTPPFAVTPNMYGETPLTAYAYPAGTKIVGPKIGQILAHEDEGSMFSFALAGATQTRCSGGGTPWAGGFCPGSFEIPKAFDFYLVRQGDFMPGGDSYAFFVPLHSVKNVILNDDQATSGVLVHGSTVQVVHVDLTPPAGAGSGDASVGGTVVAENIFRRQDFEALGGSFDNFIKFIPTVVLYDAEGNLKGAGMVTPAPDQFTQEKDALLEQSIRNNDYDGFNDNFGSLTWKFRISGLAPNTEYVQVLTTPNYPPMKNTVTTGADGTVTDQTLNLDNLVGAGGTLSGVVRSTSSAVIANAAVSIKGDGIDDKTATTDASGAYEFPGLSNGLYHVTVVAPNFVPQVKKVTVTGAGAVTQDFSLGTGAGTIRGTVYKKKFPSPQVLSGAALVAFDDTENGLNPTEPLYLYRTETSSTGVYEFTGLVPGHSYRISLAVPGKYVLDETTSATNGTVSGVDFTLLSKPLDIEVFVKPTGTAFEFLINNPSDFADGRVWYGPAPYNVAASTEVSDDFEQLPDNKLFLSIPIAGLSAEVNYVLHVEAESYSGSTVTKEVPFAIGDKARAETQIDITLLGDDSEDAEGRAANEAVLDETGQNPSSVVIPAGGMLPLSDTLIPSMEFSNTESTDTDVADLVEELPEGGVLESDVYQLELDNVNLTERGFDLKLAFDADADWTDLGAYQYDPATGEWTLVSGVQTIDPLAGTIGFTINTLTPAAAPRPGQAPAPAGMRAAFDGKKHVAAAGAPASGTASFAIMRVSQVSGSNYAGTAFKIFNFPNPFNLNTKTLALAHGGAQPTVTTDGTVIKYEIPSSVASGEAVIRIYNLAGELVLEQQEGVKQGGFYYYTTWDGRNKDGSKVANGVYYGVFSMPGVDVKDARFKLAVIK